MSPSGDQIPRRRVWIGAAVAVAVPERSDDEEQEAHITPQFPSHSFLPPFVLSAHGAARLGGQDTALTTHQP